MAAYDPEKITFFAKTDARGQQVPFGIKAKDRQRHMYVIGKTGMGKSTLLENMAAQDIAGGEGLAFIDPHGSAIEVLLDYIPEDRLDDVVYFAPFDMENPVAFNIMEDVGEDTRHLVVSGLMSTFKKIWEDAWSARMEYILTNALLALIEYPDTTLLSVNRMLADKEYRDKVIDNVKDPAVKAYWIDEFNNYTERFAAEALPAIQNKIGQFTGNPLIRNIIGQPKSSFDVRKMMDERKILLINLSKGLVGETNADLIGSMLITKIYLAAMSRAELPAAQMKMMPNFYFYVDEFQSFANSTFANILSEARKYHLNLIIAHQYVAQMEEKIRDAVFGNVGTTVAFRTGPFDAEVLETVFAPQFEATDLVNLGFAQIYLTLMIDGVGSQPFSAVTLPPVETPPKSHKHMAIKRSQQNYSKPRAEVEQMVVDSHAPEERLETAVEKGSGNKGGFTKPSGFLKVGTEQNSPQKKSGNGSLKNNQNTSTKKPKPKEKTPEDLRNILAEMSGTNVSKESKQTGVKENQTSSQSKKETSPQVENVATKELSQSELKEKSEVSVQQVEKSRAKAVDQSVAAKTQQESCAQTDNHTKEKENKDTKTPVSEQSKTPTEKTNPTGPKEATVRNADQRTSGPTKTAANDSGDLQSILLQLTNKTNQLQKDVAKQSREQNHKQTNGAPTQKNKRFDSKEDQKPPRSNRAVTSPQDMQDILRNMTGGRQRNHIESNSASAPKQPSQVDESLRSELARTLNQTPAAQAATTPKSVTPPEATPDKTVDQFTPKSVLAAETDDASVDTATQLVKQSPEPVLGGSRQPAFEPVPEALEPDLATVKKMLKTSGKERPPGM